MSILLSLFLKLSAFSLIAFGGVNALLPSLLNLSVYQEHWIDLQTFADYFAIAQAAPGPNIVNLAVCIGSRFAGAKGAVAAVLGLTLGPICIVMLLALLYTHYSYLESIQGVLRGISAVGVGLIASTGIKMLRDEFRFPAMLLVVVVTVIAASYYQLGLGWVVLIASPLAWILAQKKARKL